MKVLNQCLPPERVTVDPTQVPDVLKVAVQSAAGAIALQIPVPQQAAREVIEPLPKDDVKPEYKPTKRDYAYLDAVKQLTADGVIVTDRKLAEIMQVDYSRCAQLRKKPGFRDWLREQLKTDADDRWPLVVKTAYRLAEKGSIDHMNFLAKIRGEFKEGNGPGGGDGLHVHLHV